MSATPSRRVALEVLRGIRRGELADRALAERVESLEVRDRAWVWELVMGVQRARGRIDFLLGGLLRQGLDSVEPDVLDVLRLGAFQLLSMDGVPAYAAISESVELARDAGAGRAAKLVNGVLRSLERSVPDDAAFPDPVADPAGWLSTAGSHPRWLVERWLERWGFEETRALVDANDTRPELYIRPIGLVTVEAAVRLADAGVVTEPVAGAPDALRVVPPARAEDVFAVVPAVVQDPAATLVTRYAAVPAGARVADLCAAPGGKALTLAGEAGWVVAADISARRLDRVAQARTRLGETSALLLLAADARRPPLRPASFDVVLLDVPCTGTGTLRRHPDGKWRLRPEDLDTLAALQREILDAAADVVKPGGVLVYATCSLEPEENEAQVEAFLARDGRFEPAPADHGLDPALTDGLGRLVALPQRTGFDGAFAARLHRTK
ncbi:MAG TPA: 16S rRNA (cytosine(967)-C(5))-methyltransferase RsmB [Longimicrobiales bacterium]|nr:16S rRNA (cytosine(967)-C(5))-methyltransferase RsmB [Longimicrobiales bacterium]